MENCLKTGGLKKIISITEGEGTPCSDSEPADRKEPTDSSRVDSEDVDLNAISSEIEIAKETDEVSLKYYEEYLKCGFTINVDNSSEQVQCVICKQVLPVCDPYLSRFRQHLKKEHFVYEDKPLEFFEEKLLELQNTLIPAEVKNRTKISEETYRDLYEQAKKIDTYTVAEDLIVPCAKLIFETILGKDAATKMDMNNFRKNTLSEEILNMSNDVEATLLNRLKNSQFFALQLNWTDFTDLPVLIVMVRFMHNERLEEEMLLCRPLSETDAGVDIFFAVHTYLQKNDIDWSSCCGVSTDAAKSLTKMYKAFACCMNKMAPHVPITYCSTRSQDFVIKAMPHQLKIVLDDAVKIVNVLKERPDRTGTFQVLYDEIGLNHKPLLKYTANWWLSHQGVLRCFFAHKHEFNFYHPLLSSIALNDHIWLQKLAYLVDIFELVNQLSCSLSLHTNIFAVQSKVENLIKRLDVLATIVDENEPELLPMTLDYFLLEKQLKMNKDVKTHIIAHLCALQNTLMNNFPTIPSSYNWICNPFNKIFVLEAQNLSDEDKISLSILSGNLELKTLFGRKLLIDFWLAVGNEFPQLSEFAIKYLLPFSNTCLLEKAFSCYIALKNNYRSNICVEHDLRLYLTCIEPNFSKLCPKDDLLIE